MFFFLHYEFFDFFDDWRLRGLLCFPWVRFFFSLFGLFLFLGCVRIIVGIQVDTFLLHLIWNGLCFFGLCFHLDLDLVRDRLILARLFGLLFLFLLLLLLFLFFFNFVSGVFCFLVRRRSNSFWIGLNRWRWRFFDRSRGGNRIFLFDRLLSWSWTLQALTWCRFLIFLLAFTVLFFLFHFLTSFFLLLVFCLCFLPVIEPASARWNPSTYSRSSAC